MAKMKNDIASLFPSSSFPPPSSLPSFSSSPPLFSSSPPLFSSSPPLFSSPLLDDASMDITNEFVQNPTVSCYLFILFYITFFDVELD
jgi:hypothetical protein